MLQPPIRFTLSPASHASLAKATNLQLGEYVDTSWAAMPEGDRAALEGSMMEVVNSAPERPHFENWTMKTICHIAWLSAFATNLLDRRKCMRLLRKWRAWALPQA